MTTLFTFGDSITAGAQATAASTRYANLLSSSLGMVLDNSGVSTAMVMDQYSALCSKAPSAGDSATVMFGTNDQAKYDVSADKRKYFIEGLAAYIVRMACMPKTASAASGVAFTGPWSNSGYALGCYGSNSPGAKASFTAHGDAVALGMFRQYNNSSTFSVKIDGVDKGVFSTNGDIRTILNSAWGPMCLIFSGLGAGSHSVEIEVVAGGGAANVVFFHWFCDLSTARNKVAVGNIPKAINYTYGGSAANVDAYNADISALVRRISAFGIDVRLADVCSVLTPSDMYDNVHPNDGGHGKIATVFQAALDEPDTQPQQPVGVTFSPATIFAGSDGNFYAKSSDGTFKRISVL